MSREELKRLWFNIDHSNTPEMKRITITMDTYKDRIGQGIVKIERQGPNGYSGRSSHQKHPFTYATSSEEYKSGEYELITI